MSDAAARLWIAPDVRAATRALLARVGDDAARVRGDPSLLARPLRVVVPGGALREAVLDALVRPPVLALAGVAVQTLWSLALEVLEAAGGAPGDGALRFELELRRAVAAEPELARALAGLEDGPGLAAAAVGDLSSAALTERSPAELSRALDALAPRERERALALVRAARACEQALAAAGRARHPDVYAAAARALGDAPGLVPARELVVFGFAGATGRARALLERLAARRETLWIAVRPAGADAALALARRALGTSVAEGELAPSPPARLAAFHAAGLDDEAREVARRVRTALDEGARPEGIGVVARALEPRAAALRRALEALGVPFGGASEPAGLSPARRRLVAALDVLRDGPRAPVERWLDVLGRDAGPAREDLRLALAAAGVVRLEELARVDGAAWVADRQRIALPQRGAAADLGDGEDPEDVADTARPRRRTLETALLREAAQRARGVLELLAAWPEGGDSARQRAAWLAFAEAAGLARDARLGRPLEELARAFEELEGLAPPPARGELALWLARALDRLEPPALGGAGAGVRVLDAQSARGAAFERLFVLGCERGVFPRAPRADALLGPAARAALAPLSPELATAERAEADERWLFASLLDAADDVTLSWCRCDAQGREVAPSPAALGALAARGVEACAIERRRERLFVEAPLTARERAVGGALVGGRRALEGLLADAFAEARARFGDDFLPRGAGPAELARARVAVLDELDPPGAPRADDSAAGAYLGAAGAGALGGGEDLWVTGLERLARCPWQAFLQRGLGLEPPPDPLADLPALDALVVGNAVHHALAELAPAPAIDALALQAALAQGAQRALADAGVHLPGLAQALARRARPQVERGLALIAALPAERGCEVDGSTPDGLRFRADLVARDDAGAVLVDFKTGRPISDKKTPKTRLEHLVRAVARGTHLQVAAYAASQGARRGEYLFLREGLEDELARVPIEPGGPIHERYVAAVAALRAAWQNGAVAPRPEGPDGKRNPACDRCEVRAACLRDDSGARARLRFAAEQAAREGGEDVLLAALAGLWTLGAEAEA